MRTANDIAEWIVRYSADDLGVPVDHMSLEKLTYYAQAFHLALKGEPLFPDEVEAWKLGPVVPGVYRRFQMYGADPIVVPDDPLAQIATKVGANLGIYLAQIVGFFCQHTAMNLSRATHLETPWKEASETEEKLITQMEMKAYYRSLMTEGESALSRHELLDSVPEPRWSSFYVAGICWRKMAAHPFYDGSLAKKLSEPVSHAKKFPDDFFAPVKGRDYVEFTRDEDPSDTIKRALS
jgi:uncharacterized phage-associated protein